MTGIEEIQSGRPMSLRQQASLTVRLAVPAILAQLTSIVMQYIDASMVGRLGASPAASVGLMNSSLWLFTGVCSTVTMGFSVQVAHRIGATDYKSARQVLRQGITCCAAIGLLLMLIGLAISPMLPRWLGGDPDITGGASVYFATFIAALPMFTLNYLASSMLRCSGNMKVPSLLSVMMCVLDVVCNFFLIFPSREIVLGDHTIWMPGAGLGVFGAALGTVMAATITACFMLWYLLCREPGLKLKGEPRGSFRPTRRIMSAAWHIAWPMTLEHAVFCGAQIMVTVIVAPLGVVAIAANAFAVTAESLCYMPGFGIGDAATTLTGQSYGAGRLPLARRFCHLSVVLGVVVMTVMGALMWFCAPLMMGIMTPVAAISDLGTEVLRIQAWAEPMYAASIVTYGAFVGVGDTLIPAVMNFSSIWLVRIPVAALLAPHYGLQGVWIAMAVELTFRGLIFLWRMFSGSWLRKGLKGQTYPAEAVIDT